MKQAAKSNLITRFDLFQFQITFFIPSTALTTTFNSFALEMNKSAFSSIIFLCVLNKRVFSIH
ncbi:MAG: hypothetical protein A3D31_01595 [Candidatus Fluviicola riflensis]|nr:MAG: hypothetical protein CHH17_03945 [Candidatus Fluviicola riflensis]OGS76295.1 MAG: hypothetical protein A3D31_01595 [Candidatus Fluviicola riflensis]OGS83161.1 MAG: hypothetical protein A2724_00245 [Fluviicola sp. RIFCSPHIGHO2_01_FULL_43_53]OGS83827.1 MAG: hypothetical protein A3E30_18200 [Fluviicola sp. RIFCSPHIGHO2_12_FULL_43_24]